VIVIRPLIRDYLTSCRLSVTPFSRSVGPWMSLNLIWIGEGGHRKRREKTRYVERSKVMGCNFFFPFSKTLDDCYSWILEKKMMEELTWMSWVRGSVYDVEGLTEFTAHWTSSDSGVREFSVGTLCVAWLRKLRSCTH
jgi:hypothetical protein